MKRRPIDPTDRNLRAEASAWTVRRLRGLTPAETAEFESWIAADPRHTAEMEATDSFWERLGVVPDEVVESALEGARRRRTFWSRATIVGSLAAAAAIAIAVVPGFRSRAGGGIAASGGPPAVAAIDEPRTVSLADGTVVQLNTGGAVREDFTPETRRVHLSRGQAHFSVTRDPARPFVVRAGRIEVVAVGTAFEIQLGSSEVEVLVTEGVVKLGATDRSGRTTEGDLLPFVNSGHRARINLAPSEAAAAVVVSPVSEAELARASEWRQPLLRVGGATLAEIAADFSRRTGRKIVIADPELGAFRFGGRLRADNLDGFAALVADTMDLHVERSADGTLVFRKKDSGSR